MSMKKYVIIAITVFLVFLVLAICISARFSLSNITADAYAFIESFLAQWAPALGALSTIILVGTIFWAIHDSRRSQERTKEQVIHALHDEIHSNLTDIITLRFGISEMLRKLKETMVSSAEDSPYQPIDTDVFDNMRNSGQLHWLEDMRMNVIYCYKLIKAYNQDATFQPHHLELLARIYEGLMRAIGDLEAKFKFLPHYVGGRDTSQQAEAETGGFPQSNGSAVTQER